ncbi:MAG: trigger factor [Candidatus Cyclobacteriaceae bacterium M3_2C_046]
MDITLDKNSATEASIKIKLSEDDYKPSVQKKLKEYSKKANIKGFRPGKVPVSLMNKMYGKSVLVEELNHILTHSLNDYINENNLKLLGDPIPKEEKAGEIDFDTQKEFEFEYEVGLADEFSYQFPENLDYYEIEVDEKQIEETLENIRNQHAKTENPEISEAGDYLNGDLNQVNGDIERSTAISIDEVVESERAKFIGMKVNDEIVFDIRKTFEKDSVIAMLLDKPEAEIKDYEGEYSFKINLINRRIPAEINQEFFDGIFGPDQVKTEAELRDKIEENIKESYKQESEYLLQKTIKDKLVADTEIELPNKFLKKWLLKTDQKLTAEEVDKEYENFKKDMKWNLIKNKIAEENDIKVEHEEINERAKALIANYFQQSGLSAQQMGDQLDAFAQNYLQAENGKNYMNLQEQLKNEKVISHVREKVSLNEKKVDMEEFKKLAMN